jgi:glycosyltransferase involved in cell wall biosynthesis
MEADSFSPVRIAIDARALLPPTTGIGTYTRGVAGGLASMAGSEVRLFSPRPLPETDCRGPWTVEAGSHLLGMIWAQTALSRRARAWGADVLLAALTIGPVRGDIPFVSVVHDLTPWTNPEWHKGRTLVGFAPLWERTVERAARLLCVSHATAGELTRAYPETRDRVRVVWNGVDSDFAPPEPAAALDETRRRYSGGNPYILYLGTLEPRKNVETLVAACELLWSRRAGFPDLVIAGGAGWKTSALFDRIEKSRYRERIHKPGYAARKTARDLYQAAEVFVYPSLAEGFGLPVLEAMASGLPVVASTAEALREVAGDAALFADPGDPAAFSRAIERVLDDPAARARLRAAGLRRAAEFSWEACARATAGVLAEAAAEANR